MSPESIKEILNKKPWRPMAILLDGGETVLVRHPESIFIGRENILIENPDGTIEYFGPENVSKVRRLSRRRAV